MKLKIKIKNIYSIINKIYRNNTKIYKDLPIFFINLHQSKSTNEEKTEETLLRQMFFGITITQIYS